MEEEQEKRETIENKKVILIQPYKVSSSTILTSSISFISDEVENLAKYMKFVKSPSQTRIFQPPPHYQSLKSWGEQDPIVTNFIQLVFPQLVGRFSQTKLCWKAPNESYPHICGMYKSNNKWLRYQAISSCKSFVC